MKWAFCAVRPRGSIVLAAAPAALGTLDPTPLWYHEIKVLGVLAYGPVLWDGQWVHPYQILIPKLANRTLRFSDLATHYFALGDYVAAFRSLVNRKQTAAIKVVFQP